MIRKARPSAQTRKLRLFFIAVTSAFFGFNSALECMAQDRSAAGEGIQVRMLLADNSGQPSSGELKDILPLLQQNLRFNSYRLMARKLTSASTSITKFPFGYQLQYADVALPSLTVNISRRGKDLLRTRLRLQTERPVIVGGFPHGDNSTVIMVLELRGAARQ